MDGRFGFGFMGRMNWMGLELEDMVDTLGLFGCHVHSGTLALKFLSSNHCANVSPLMNIILCAQQQLGRRMILE